MTTLPGRTLASDSPTYLERRARFDRLLTVFGRKPVLEALQTDDVRPVRLHLADSNRDSADLREMRAIAQRRQAEIVLHDRRELSRISKNGKQDQGVALDIEAPRYQPLESLLSENPGDRQLLAVDGITNPQNLGMIIRTVAASPMSGLVVAKRGSAKIDGLVIKASAGTLFKCPLYYCDRLAEGLTALREAGYRIVGLDSKGSVAIADVAATGAMVFVLGNETHGLSTEVSTICEAQVSIPLANGVESLNVSIAAALVAFRTTIGRSIKP